MSQNVRSFLEFLVVAIVLAVVVHSQWRRLVPASCLAGALASLTVITFWSVRQGYFDGWYIISSVTLFAFGAGVAFAIGGVFHLWRRWRLHPPR